MNDWFEVIGDRIGPADVNVFEGSIILMAYAKQCPSSVWGIGRGKVQDMWNTAPNG